MSLKLMFGYSRQRILGEKHERTDDQTLQALGRFPRRTRPTHFISVNA
jgi:hypothetical protein